uniref:beta-glucuronosyltransferase GlcAT14A-like n=1 Tax=Erigeron canadensis TaxID=72917 RepID=UPI001CB8F07F|nr:beta-glucuronosyltransferase GlcAT14A-like [Erigeron canadensis]XP_043608340.1 beta-glucuronosyltransferase GlcAT14A-like [Erigeron canadensis]
MSILSKKHGHTYSGRAHTYNDKKWIIPFLVSLAVWITLISSSYNNMNQKDYLSLDKNAKSFSDSEIIANIPKKEKAAAPRFAYLISGTKGDSKRMMRTLQAVYHPRNHYILHMDLEAPPRERLELTMAVKNDVTFSAVENVRVMAQSNLVTYKGPTMIATTLQAIAILFKDSLDWDWFINLSASDYPLVTQDDLLHVFSNMSRTLNFIEHTKLTGWKLNQRAKPIIVDPGLYLSKKSDLAITSQRRSLPTSFNLFTGSAWVMVTRAFMEYCIWGLDNFPRTVLMYYTNFVSSPEGYFHTVICNTEEFTKTVISHDLHYIAWDYPPKQHPRYLTIKDFDKMVNSSAPFARKFPKDDIVLDKIDKELLGRTHRFGQGAWCAGGLDHGSDPCLVRGDDSVFRPGPGATRLTRLFHQLLSEDFKNKSCPT